MFDMMDIIGYDRLPIELSTQQVLRLHVCYSDQRPNVIQLEHHPKSDFHEVRELVHSFLNIKRQPKEDVCIYDRSSRC